MALVVAVAGGRGRLCSGSRGNALVPASRTVETAPKPLPMELEPQTKQLKKQLRDADDHNGRVAAEKRGARETVGRYAENQRGPGKPPFSACKHLVPSS
ncbi:MAG: hypothetical protein WKG07_23285 [Hymenobacter sp.]